MLSGNKGVRSKKQGNEEKCQKGQKEEEDASQVSTGPISCQPVGPKQESIENQIKRRKWNWIGHTLGRPNPPITCKKRVSKVHLENRA